MTNDENPADTMIKQAAKVGAEAIYWTLEWEQLDDETRSDATEFARALHEKGWLADPADRVTANAVCHLLGGRLRRAEAERDLLRAQVAAVRALADEWRYRPHPEGAESVSDWIYRMHEQSLGSLLGLALDTAGGERQ